MRGLRRFVVHLDMVFDTIGNLLPAAVLEHDAKGGVLTGTRVLASAVRQTNAGGGTEHTGTLDTNLATRVTKGGYTG